MGKSTRDPVTAWADAAVHDRARVGKLARQAAARHLSDLKASRAKGLEWRSAEAQRAIDFFAEVLRLPEPPDSSRPSEPFVLAPFQAFIVGSLFGWYRSDGFRRFKTAYIETAKGSGKTPLGAGIMLYLLVADGQPRAQIYAAATAQDQARLAFVDAEAMVNASPELKKLVRSTVNNLAIAETGSFFRAISSEKRGLDGKRVHGALIDELHEHPTAIVVNKLRAGVKNLRNALIVEITNSGFDRTSVCWQHHEYSRKVLDGTIQADDWFALICGLDPCDACAAEGRWFPAEGCPDCDQWDVEGPHWYKPNPNLDACPGWDYVRGRVQQAKGMPSDVSDVLRFNFCVWTQGSSRAIDMGRWAICRPMPSDDELIGAPCYGALDLGETDDFSAWARLWLLEDGRVAVKMRYWVPRVALERYPNRPYAQWERASSPGGKHPGLFNVTEGDTTDYMRVRETIRQDCARDGVIAIAYDPKSATETAQVFTGEGITMVNTRQGFALHEAIKRFLELVMDGDFCHGNDPILTWMASNVVLRDGTKQEKRLDKERSPEKIDGIAAIVTGIDWGIVRKPIDPPNPYLSHGVRNLADYLEAQP